MASTDPAFVPAPLQFGVREPGVDHKDRPAAFGIAEHDGCIALVRVQKPGAAPWLDLPGGALDAREGEAEALRREFGEETGLIVACGPLVARADQYFLKTEGEPVNNRSGVFEATVEGDDPALKIEDDHTLVWMPPQEAAVRLRHDSHAWAVLAWLRRRAA